jgi:chitinase
MKNKLKLFALLVLLNFYTILKASDYKVVGYFPDWGGNLNNFLNSINVDALTHINYSFGIPNTSTGQIYIANPSLLKNMVTKAHAVGAKVNISIGGAGGASTAIATICSNTTKRDAMVDSIENFIKIYNLDGVDLDWEFPESNTEIARLEDLLMKLRIKLNAMETAYGRYIELTVATNGTDYYGKTLTSTAVSYLDYINIMTYDGGSPHHSSVEYANTGLNYWSVLRGVPASMLVVGVPFYSRNSGLGYGDYRTFSVSNPSAAYNDTDGYYNDNGYIHDFNSKPILEEKADLVKNTYQSGGMMIWELTQDRTDQYSLLDVIGTEMETFVGAKEASKELHNISFYPNPFSNETYIDLQKLNSIDDNMLIEISDLNGKIIHSQSLSSTQKFTFDKSLASGMYFCKISDSKAIYNSKLIKE